MEKRTVIRFLREKFRGNLDRKHRRLSAEFQQVRASENRLAKRRKKIVTQMAHCRCDER